MALLEKLASYWRMAISPVKTFTDIAAHPPRPLKALAWMLLFRAPLLWASTALAYSWAAQIQQIFKEPQPMLFDAVDLLTGRAEEVFFELGSLPNLPPLGDLWLWMGIFALLWLIGLWMHNAVWDHLGLWILRGARPKPSFRFSAAAIAEAMGAASLASILRLIAMLPVLGLFALPLIGAAGAYFWVLRGTALSIFHDSPIWKGIVAILLHLLLAGLFYLALLVFSVIAVFLGIAMLDGSRLY